MRAAAVISMDKEAADSRVSLAGEMKPAVGKDNTDKEKRDRMNKTVHTQENPLGYKSIPELLRSFAIPSIIAMVVSSLYNIVDQIFIGQGVGYLGNAATNVAYPLTTICLAIALLIGIGSALVSPSTWGRGRRTKRAGWWGTASA